MIKTRTIQDNELPYDRTSLSKGFGTPVEKILLRSEEFYKTNGIQVHRGREVDRFSFSSSFSLY